MPMNNSKKPLKDMLAQFKGLSNGVRLNPISAPTVSIPTTIKPAVSLQPVAAQPVAAPQVNLPQAGNKTWTPWTAQNMFSQDTIRANQQNLGLLPASFSAMPTDPNKPSKIPFQTGNQSYSPWQQMSATPQPSSMNQNMFSGAMPWMK